MGMLTLYSQNPNFSYVIQKNPNTIAESKKPFERALRKGKIYGWFSDKKGQVFRLWFKDADNECSFATGRFAEFEYLDRTRYASPYMYVAMITAALRTALTKHDEEYDVPSSTTLAFNLNVDYLKNLNILQQQFSKQGIDLRIQNLAGKSYYVRVTAKTVYEALNAALIICVFQAYFEDPISTPNDYEALLRYVRSLNALKSPYSTRYLFSSFMVGDAGAFNKIKKELELPNTSMNFGNTQRQKYAAIDRVLKNYRAETLVDLGCGEMYNTSRLARAYSVCFAIDGDDDLYEKNYHFVRRRKMEEVLQPLKATITPEWVKENSDIFDDADVLMTEFVEHNDKNEAINILKAVLETKAKRIVVTVPNRNFNINYEIEPGTFRHDDHKWEPDALEFSSFSMLRLNDEPNLEDKPLLDYTLTIQGIGDMVNGEHVSLMAIYTRNA